MKQVNFSHSGGFPLEQETLERIQTAYRTELFAAIKSHLSIEKNTNYIVAQATTTKLGWAIIHQDEKDPTGDSEGILYPIQKADYTGYLKTIRTGTNLIYGAGTSQTAYYDYQAVYINQTEFLNGVSQINDAETIYFYDLSKFKVVKDIQSIEKALQTYLPLDGSKAMKGDLDLDIYQLSKLDIKESSVASVRVADFRLGTMSRRGLLKPSDPTGRALVDSSDQSTTSLTVNYDSDWDNTYIGGKVFLNNINTSNATGSLLVVDNANQVTKSNTLIDSLLNRITALEIRPTTAVPIGMIAIWGKSAPFPEGWEEYVPLRGRMPVGFDSNQLEFDTMGKTDGAKTKTLEISEMPNHGHDWKYSYERDDDNKGSSFNEFTFKPGEILETDEINPIGKTGGGLPFSIMNPYKVVHFIEYTGRPVAPNPVFLRVRDVGRSIVELVWIRSTDNKNVTNFLVYMDDILVGKTNGEPFHTVGGLSRSSSYNFYVITQDVAGNLSVPSNVVRAKTKLL